MSYQINHTQLWYKELKTVDGSPDLDRTSTWQQILAPVEGQRILACRSEGDHIHWLIQSGMADNIWFTWVRIDMVERK